MKFAVSPKLLHLVKTYFQGLQQAFTFVVLLDADGKIIDALQFLYFFFDTIYLLWRKESGLLIVMAFRIVFYPFILIVAYNVRKATAMSSSSSSSN